MRWPTVPRLLSTLGSLSSSSTSIVTESSPSGVPVPFFTVATSPPPGAVVLLAKNDTDEPDGVVLSGRVQANGLDALLASALSVTVEHTETGDTAFATTVLT